MRNRAIHTRLNLLTSIHVIKTVPPDLATGKPNLNSPPMRFSFHVILNYVKYITDILDILIYMMVIDKVTIIYGPLK